MRVATPAILGFSLAGMLAFTADAMGDDGPVITRAVSTYASTEANANDVDRIAGDDLINEGRIISGWDGYNQFRTDVAAAYDAGLGGVADWESQNLLTGHTSDKTHQVRFDNDNKHIEFYHDRERDDDNVAVNRIGGHSAIDAALSGSRVLYPFYDSYIRMNFENNEQPITQIGIVVLDRGDKTGTTAFEAHFSDGQVARVSADFDGETSDEDTFYGFIAPEGVHITYFGATTGAAYNNAMPTDDLGFIVVPEPGALGLLSLGVTMLLGRRRRRMM